MSAHTPGPWLLSSYYSDALTVTDEQGFAIVEANTTVILQGYAEKLGIEHWADSPGVAYRDLNVDEQAANARLIAAAPELLVALRRAAELLARYPKHDDAWNQARAAIAKAEGGAA